MKRKKANRKVRNTLCLAVLLGVFALGGMLLERAAVAPAQVETHVAAPANPDAVPPALPALSGKPEIDADDWRLTLVNRWNPLPVGFAVQTAEVEGGFCFDARAADRLTAMLDGCRAAGLNPLLCSAYRTPEYQTELFQKQVRKQEKRGLAGGKAVQAAGEVVAVPGTSEHELGLAADIASRSFPELDERQEQTAEYQWLREHCAEYGFILRYPPEKTDITGIIYEPWHFRYVGEDAAAYIMEHGLTLEEFLAE